jgi:hypothetical protein
VNKDVKITFNLIKRLRLNEKRLLKLTKKKPHINAGLFYYGARGRSRTSDRLVRSQVLYPAELHAQNQYKMPFINIAIVSTLTILTLLNEWRRGRDSNPRWDLKPILP